LISPTLYRERCSLPEGRHRRHARSEATLAAAMRRWERIDILHNNVGVSVAGGDRPLWS
jgi:hypothetical protein